MAKISGTQRRPNKQLLSISRSIEENAWMLNLKVFFIFHHFHY